MVRAEDVFSFLNRQLTLPISCVAMVWSEAGQPTVAQAGQPIESHGIRELLFVRTVPFALDYDVDDLASADGYAVSASVKLPVHVVPDRAELAAFRKAILGSSNEVSVGHLRQHCEEAVRAALTAFAKARDAGELVSAATWSECDAVLAEHLKPVGFASGLALGLDPRVSFDSVAYAASCRELEAEEQRRKRREADGQLRAAAAKARQEHLAELGTLLEQVKRMAGENPDLAAADLIKTFDPAQRGTLYEGLVALHQPTRRTEAILVIAGDEMIWLDPNHLSRPTRRQGLASDIGPLRSVRLACHEGKPVLLVGARRGVHMVDHDTGLRQTYALDTEAEPRGGVNAAVIVGEHLYATHSEVGLVRWELAKPDSQKQCLADVTGGATAVRDVQLDDAGGLWFSVDHKVVGWSPDTEAPPMLLPVPTAITALLVADGFIHAGLDNGRIVRWVVGDPAEMETLRSPTGNAVCSLDWIAGGGIPRLLISDGRPHLDLQVVDDAYLGEYRSEDKLRWGFATEDWIVGVNDRRDQLLTWRLDSPKRPAASVSVGRLCGRSIQDVALLPADPADGASRDEQPSATAL